MPPLLFGRQSGNRNAQALLMQSLLIPTFAAKQHGRNFASQRPAEILLSANHCTIEYRMGFPRFLRSKMAGRTVCRPRGEPQ